MDNIILVGMSGVGKSTIARELGIKLNCGCFDTDSLVEAKTNKSIPELFEKNESHFREYERQIIQQLKNSLAHGFCIIATGGGSVLLDENIAILKRLGKIIFLNEIPQFTYEKLLRNIYNRPLYNNKDYKYFESVYNQRLPIYKAIADIEIDVTNKSIKDVINLIEKYI